MAERNGRIRSEDVEAVKERVSITDVVREHVTLRPAGPGSMKGLCPFHDEKTPSFTVRETVGAYHCFGCGEGGDVISFVQKLDHLTFAEAVERLAGKLGMELRYDEGGGPRDGVGLGKRSRLLEAHRVAAEFYHSRLLETPEARIGRDFLRERGFASPEAKLFGIGYAPRGGEELARHLRALAGEDAGEGVADGGPPRTAEVDRPGGVGGDELEVDPRADTGVGAAVVGAGLDDRARELAGAGGVEADVDETGPGDVGRGDPVGRRQPGGQRGRELARRHPGGLGELEGDVRRPVPVLALLRALHPDLVGDGGGEGPLVDGGLERLPDRGGELFGSHGGRV